MDDDYDSDPDWIIQEKDEFAQTRDKNGDGYLDHSEVAQWILPEEEEYIREEAEHLVFEADEDQVCCGWR